MSKNLWELSLLAHHFHPSVSKFTAGSRGDISYKGDPLKDFGLAPFLDKFAFRNPKSLDKLSKQLKRGESIAERKTGLSGNTALPMNDPSYLEGKPISEEDSFFHQFFVERAKRDGIKGITRGSGAATKDKDQDESDLEDEALNAAEADEVIADMEGDTDSEEENFVNQLAEKLMESAGNGKANLDNEDPDMDGWSDFDDDDDEDGKLEDGDDDNSAELGKEGNEDSFMDAASSDDGEENVSGAIEGEESGSDDDDDDDLPFGLMGEDESDDDSFSGNEPSKDDDQRQSKRKESTSIYADAEEYEHMMEEESKNHLQDKTSQKKNKRRKNKP